MNPLTDDPDPTPAELAFWAAGDHPSWKRVWKEGVDVTDQDPSTWPPPWNGQPIRSKRSGRSRKHG